MVEGEFDAIEPGSRGPPRGPRARERGGLAGNHGPPHWQASSAGETRLTRVVSRYPRLRDGRLGRPVPPAPTPPAGTQLFRVCAGPARSTASRSESPGFSGVFRGRRAGSALASWRREKSCRQTFSSWFFKDLETTLVLVDVAWRIHNLFWRSPPAATALRPVCVRTVQSGASV